MKIKNTNSQNLKHLLIMACLMGLAACSNAASTSETPEAEDPQPTNMEQLGFQATGEETATCRVLSVESESVGSIESLGGVGLNLNMSDDIEVIEEPADTFTTSVDTSEFSITLAEDDSIVANIEFEAFVASPDVAPDVLDVFILGLENPEVDTDYTVTIAADSILCADGSTNSSDYEIDLTVLHTDVSYSE